MDDSTDRTEIESLLRLVQSLGMREKRLIFSCMREGATRHELLPDLGVTFEQVCMGFVLADHAK